MKRGLFLAAIALVAVIAGPRFVQSADGVPRVGIISDAGTRVEADLLLIELQKAKCEMVERDEIGKVLKEQAFQASFNRTEVQRIGRLLKADGLVLLSASRTGQMSFDSALIEGSTKLLTSFTNQTLTVRLVAVDPGVLTWCEQSPLGTPDWVATTAAMLTGFLPKLSVKANTATPVSLLRIRPTNGYASSIRLADALSPLLWQRLAREPSLFVLDRENLPHVVEEAQWNGQEPGFWAGSVLVEGRASHDLANTNQCLFTLTVQRPVAGTNTYTRTEWTEAGELTDLPGLVERAAVRLRQEIGIGSNKVPWDPRAEGQRLLAIVPHLVDPRQQKAALGTAMSLGCRDIKTANDYRVALRSIAYRDAVRFSDVTLHLARGSDLVHQAKDFLELIRFHNDYRPPGGFDPNYKSAWHSSQESEWLFSYFQPLKDIETFFDAVKGAKRAGEISAVIQEIQAACRETARRLLVIDPYYQKFQQGQIPLHNARYRCTTMREILDTDRRFLFPPKTNDNYNVIGSTVGLWFLERPRAEVVFPDARTESAAERDRLWSEFEQQVLTSDRPDIRINLALRDLQQAKTPDEQRNCRRRLQKVFAECSVAFAIAPTWYDYSSLYLEAFPTNTVVMLAQTYPRPVAAVTKLVPPDELAANAHAAYRLFLAITPPTKLREADIHCLIRPYLAFLSEEEMRPVYRTTIDSQQTFPRPIDTFAIQQWIGERFPALLDETYRTERARRLAASQPSTAPSMLPKECLFVTNSIVLSSDCTRKPGLITSYQWQGDLLRLIWDNDYLHVDTVRRVYESVPLPPPPQDDAGNIVDVHWLDDSVQLVRPGDWLIADATRRTCERVVFPSPQEKTTRKIHGVHWLDGAVRVVRDSDLVIVDTVRRACEHIVFPSLPGGGLGAINGIRWLDDSVHLIRDGHYLVVDTRRRTCERIDPPLGEDYPGTGMWTPSLTSAEAMLVFLKSFELDSSVDRPGTWMAWRLAAGGNWRVARLTFGVGSVTSLNGKFYFTTGAPRIVVYQGNGVIEYDPETERCVTLRAPGAPLARRTKDDKNKPITFENLEFGHGIRDGLLCGMMGQRLYGWDPVTKTVKDLTIPKPLSPKGQRATSSRDFGFEIPRDPSLRSSNWSPISIAGQTITHQLWVTHQRGKFMDSIPLCFPRLPNPVSAGAQSGTSHSDPPADAQVNGIDGPVSLLVPYESRRALHVIPYADIQQWLASNSPPIATTNAASASSTTKERR